MVQDKFLVLFNKYAGDEKSVDASELQLVLGDVYKDGTTGSPKIAGSSELEHL